MVSESHNYLGHGSHATGRSVDVENIFSRRVLVPIRALENVGAAFCVEEGVGVHIFLVAQINLHRSRGHLARVSDLAGWLFDLEWL